ncbi:MAG: hypothetical protein Q9216_001371 [Gyalolechia sp. 2 TL-2023]
MALIRRGKSGPRNGFNPSKGRSIARRGGPKNGSHGNRDFNAAPSNPFKASRVDEAIDSDSESSDAIPEANDAHLGLEESSSHESSSESDVDSEKPYSVLLQALKPSAPRGEPRRKKQKIEPIEAPVPVTADVEAQSDAEEGIEDEDDLLEEDSETSGVDESVKKHDCFSNHLVDRDEKELASKIQAVRDNKWATEAHAVRSLWSAIRRVPIGSQGKQTETPRSPLRLEDLKFKSKFEAAAGQLLSNSSGLSIELSASMFNYYDVLFAARSLRNADEIRKSISVHSLNHIFRTRDKVLKNTAKLSKNEHDDDDDVEFRDQGFTRPKVLMLLPTRQSCVKMVNVIVTLCEPEQQENKKRFQDSYAGTDDHFSTDKPEDFKDLFGGNDDDMFRLGLKFTRKTIKFFSQFYNSDIIIASPLGLRTAFGGESSKKQDFDFLSSIEIVIVDQGDALLMQNWEHIDYVFEHLNLQPKEAHGCDFSRVRSWYLDGHAKYLRQTILLSSFNFPALNRLYTQHMLNVDGKVKIARAYDGAIMDLGFSIRQTFSRFDFADPTSEPDDRFDYFTTAVLPSLTKKSLGVQQGTLVFVPLYADFVRVRNHLASASSTQHISFGSISEYTSVKDVARARSHFLTGRHSILLYTERAHHFRRYHLKGIKRVILYSLPENPLFYTEVVGGFLGSSISQAKVDSQRVSVRCLFSKLDLLKLERIVGTKRYLSMVSERGDTFDFV